MKYMIVPLLLLMLSGCSTDKPITAPQQQQQTQTLHLIIIDTLRCFKLNPGWAFGIDVASTHNDIFPTNSITFGVSIVTAPHGTVRNYNSVYGYTLQANDTACLSIATTDTFTILSKSFRVNWPGGTYP